MKKFFGLIFFFSTFLSPLMGEVTYEQLPFMDSSAPIANEPRLMINNRPLAKINGKVISLYDVVKKMNLFLFDYDPDYKISVMEKYQFYSSRWEATLDDMIADELVLLDAEQKEIAVSDGQIREELQERFGPNIRSNLDKVDLEYEEARDIIRADLTVNQLVGTKVHAKAFQIVTPEVIKKAYTEYLSENPAKEEWTYQVLSIRGENKELCESVAQKAYNLLQNTTSSVDSLEDISTAIQEEGVSISISDDFRAQSGKISKLHFDVIKALSPNMISKPISQVSRFDNSSVLRLFHVKDVVRTLPESFGVMHDKLKNQLLFKTSDAEKLQYVNTLKKRFGYDVEGPKLPLPEDYHPFLLL